MSQLWTPEPQPFVSEDKSVSAAFPTPAHFFHTEPLSGKTLSYLQPASKIPSPMDWVLGGLAAGSEAGSG